MAERLAIEEQLQLISRAWGRQSGYCFFPTIRGDAKDKRERILSYSEHRAFLWPKDKEAILDHLRAHKDDDVYWCPSLFEEPRRRLEYAMDEHCLWADLDEVNPKDIEDYPPTIAWETSPGRYQALWLITAGDIQGASWAGNENQKLTYHLGADSGGWDTTQLLRIPGWPNHKPDYRKKTGHAPVGKLITQRGRRYLPDDFSDLPDVPAVSTVADVLEDHVESLDRQELWGEYRLKVSKRVRELFSAREVTGDRSDVLWEMERELADAGASVAEVVALIRGTVWNKYAGRSDEFRRLTTEAAKAVSLRDPSITRTLEEEAAERPKPINIFTLVKHLPPPEWLVRHVLTAGSVGFIAGQPKSYKSWSALDLALSVASGQPFLNYFTVEQPGPVLYIQEEDSGPAVKKRLNKIWPSKMGDQMRVVNGEIIWYPATSNHRDEQSYERNGLELPPLSGYIGEGFTISNPGWQVWLDEVLTEGYPDEGYYQGEQYKLLVLDPLMMIAGEVEENKAQAMTEHVFKPLKQLSRKHGVAIQVVHHMKKGDPKAPQQRGGQLLLGSVANHAWSEDSMYFRLGRGGIVICEQESKNAPVPGFTISHLRNKRWEPLVAVSPEELSEQPSEGDRGVRQGKHEGRTRKPRAKSHRVSKSFTALHELGKPSTVAEIAKTAGVTNSAVTKSLQRAAAMGLVTKTGGQYTMTDTGLQEFSS